MQVCMFQIQILINLPFAEFLLPTVLDLRITNTKLLQYQHITQFPDINILFTIAIIFKFYFVTESCTKNSTEDQCKAYLEMETSCLFGSNIKTNNDV